MQNNINLKEMFAANAIQKELLEFIKENPKMDFFEATEEFYSDYADTNSISFAFDEEANVSIIEMY